MGICTSKGGWEEAERGRGARACVFTNVLLHVQYPSGLFDCLGVNGETHGVLMHSC